MGSVGGTVVGGVRKAGVMVIGKRRPRLAGQTLVTERARRYRRVGL